MCPVTFAWSVEFTSEIIEKSMSDRRVPQVHV